MNRKYGLTQEDIRAIGFLFGFFPALLLSSMPSVISAIIVASSIFAFLFIDIWAYIYLFDKQYVKTNYPLLFLVVGFIIGVSTGIVMPLVLR